MKRILSDFSDQIMITPAVADLSNDGHLEVLVANTRVHSIHILFSFSNRSVTMNSINYSTERSSLRQVFVVDMNDDNRLDVPMLHDETNGTKFFYSSTLMMDSYHSRRVIR